MTIRTDKTRPNIMNALLWLMRSDHNRLPTGEPLYFAQDEDANGKLIIRSFVDALKKDQSAWVEYMWPKPGSEKPAKKLSYIRKVKMPDGGTVIVGAGMYVTERLSLTTTASDKWETFARSEFIRRHAAGQCAWIVIVSMNCLFEPEQSAIVQRLSAGLADVESKSIQNAGHRAATLLA